MKGVVVGDQHTPGQHTGPQDATSSSGSLDGEGGFTPITSQQQLDEVIDHHLGALRGQVAGYSALQEQYGALEQQHGVLESKLASVTDELAGAREAKTSVEDQLASQQALVEEAQTNRLRGQIAHEKGLAYQLVKYVQGTTLEQITSSVSELQGAVDGARRAPITGVGHIVQPVSGLEDENYVRSMLLGALR